MATSMQEISAKYKKYVAENPDTIGNVESAIRIVSYLLPGRSDDSGSVLSEMCYSASGLLALVNDSILRKAAGLHLALPVPHSQMLNWLSLLEYTSVFLELWALKMMGNAGRWMIISVIQITKACLRLLILLRNRKGILASPPIPHLIRSTELKEFMENVNNPKQKNQDNDDEGDDSESDEDQTCVMETSASHSETFSLKRSQRRVRSLAAAPPIQERNWQLPLKDEGIARRNSLENLAQPLSQQQIVAEGLHIVRPILHLLGLAKWGESSWKPWLLSAGIDISSLKLMGDPQRLEPLEAKELKRRSHLMLLYLLRSPCYDRFSKMKILLLLGGLSNSIPGFSHITAPLAQYLQYWQKIYAYAWMM